MVRTYIMGKHSYNYFVSYYAHSSVTSFQPSRITSGNCLGFFTCFLSYFHCPVFVWQWRSSDESWSIDRRYRMFNSSFRNNNVWIHNGRNWSSKIDIEYKHKPSYGSCSNRNKFGCKVSS
jgi:hypothetical protein